MTSSAIRYTPRVRVSSRKAGQKFSGATMPLVPAFGSMSTAANCCAPCASIVAAMRAAAAVPQSSALRVLNGQR